MSVSVMEFNGLHFNSVGDLEIGLITGFSEASDSPTGYRMSMYVRSREKYYNVSESVWRLQFSPDYNPYPCLGEYFFSPVYDESGTVVRLVDVNDIYADGNPIKTGLSVGTYAMFRVPITTLTPTVGSYLSFSEGCIRINGLELAQSRRLLTNLVYGGAISSVSDGVCIRLASDADVYTWDWRKAKQPFARCSREEAARRGYVTRFSLGSIEDMKNDCYWFSMYSTRGDESVCDMVNIFLNSAPGWQ